LVAGHIGGAVNPHHYHAYPRGGDRAPKGVGEFGRLSYALGDNPVNGAKVNNINARRGTKESFEIRGR
jgi:hypothetical protein